MNDGPSPQTQHHPARKERPRMTYSKVNMKREWEKLKQGKKTKVDVGHLLSWATRDYPHINVLINEAFSITVL
jgi:hypothetical protein